MQAVKRFMKLECKCHGVSGSCTLRTCWMAMSDFRKTGDYLRRKYNGAIEVTMNQDGTGFTVANKDFRKATKTDLVYFENSPDYCLQDKEAGKMAELRQVNSTERKRASFSWMLMDYSEFTMCLCVCSCMTTVFVCVNISVYVCV